MAQVGWFLRQLMTRGRAGVEYRLSEDRATLTKVLGRVVGEVQSNTGACGGFVTEGMTENVKPKFNS